LPLRDPPRQSHLFAPFPTPPPPKQKIYYYMALHALV
jgi:hypothetical protein